MNPRSLRWKAITPSSFDHERDALEWIRERLPDHDPWRAWSNFELLADDGSINEIDLLVLSPVGLFVIEIKSWRGAISGDTATWRSRFDGRQRTDDNPLFLTNLKAKRLKSRLARQRSTHKQWLPYVEPLVFLSATDVQVQLDTEARQGIFGRDRRSETTGLAGLIAHLTGEDTRHRGDSRIDRSLALRLGKALDEAGVRPSRRHRTVGEYDLVELLFDGEAYQDWRAEHKEMKKALQRRIRIYVTANAPGTQARNSLERAAKRELLILKGIRHPGILTALDYKSHELGPALLFETDPQARRLDHLLADNSPFDVDRRLHLVRELAETLSFAHSKRLFHRALSPQSILVRNAESEHPQPVIYNWQTGVREASSTLGSTRPVTATVHPDRLVETASTAYMAPEVRTHHDADGAAADLFSLGAITYHLFAGRPPASSHLELVDVLRQQREGLSLSASTDGVPPTLETLVAMATHPVVSERLSSASDFLEYLDEVWDELTRPAEEQAQPVAPENARRGDVLGDGWLVEKRLGQGASSFVFLARRSDEDPPTVLKVARSPDHDAVIANEAEVLEQLRHHLVVELYGTTQIAGRQTLRLARAGDETLADRLRENGRLSLDLLQRWGEDLLSTVAWLEEKGIPHRDLKPDNLGIQAIGKNKTLHLVLFDFSLSRASADLVQAGTPPYLDPFLPLRETPRWDLAAERFAAAVTLYEMSTGRLPTWGDGKTDPQFLDGEVDLATDLFYSTLRGPLTSFFEQALRRDASERFDNSDEMLKHWRQVFATADQPALPTTPGDSDSPQPAAVFVGRGSQIIELDLSKRAFHALENLGVETVGDLLQAHLGELQRMRGVGAKTRDEILKRVRRLRKRFAAEPAVGEQEPDAAEEAKPEAGYDVLAERLLPTRSRPKAVRPLRLLLGLDGFETSGPAFGRWPSQSDVAREVGLTRARVAQILARQRQAWARLPGLTAARREITALLDLRGGVVTAEEAISDLATDDSLATVTGAVVRAAWETEGSLEAPTWVALRRGERVFLAREAASDDGPSAGVRADWTAALGTEADRLAQLDPLPSPAAAVEALRAVGLPGGGRGESHQALSSSRLVHLAAAASRNAAVSGRLELYPRGLPADRALRLAGGVIIGSVRGEIGAKQLVDRVAARYPEAERLPERPELDRILEAEGFELRWDPKAGKTDSGEPLGAYRLPGPVGLPSSTATLSRLSQIPRVVRSPELAEVEALDGRLERHRRDGGLLLVLVDPRHLAHAERGLRQRFAPDLAHESFDRIFLDHLRATARTLGVRWDVVLDADAAARGGRDFQNLLTLVDRTLPAVERDLLDRDGSLLLVHPGLLARYERFEFLEGLRDRLSQAPSANGHRLQSLWVLVPSDRQTELPRLDGRTIPVIGPGDWVRLSTAWLQAQTEAIA